MEEVSEEYISNPLLLGELTMVRDEDDSSDEDRRSEMDEEEQAYLTGRASEDEEGAEGGERSARAEREMQSMTCVEVHSAPEESHDRSLSLSLPRLADRTSPRGDLPPALEPPELRVKKLAPIGSAAAFSKSDPTVLQSFPARGQALEKGLVSVKPLDLSPVFSLDKKVLPKTSFSSVGALPPITPNTHPSPRFHDTRGHVSRPPGDVTNARNDVINSRNDVTNSRNDESGDVITWKANGPKSDGDNGKMNSSAAQEEDKEPTTAEPREIKKIYDRCKERDEYTDLGDHLEGIFKSAGSVAGYFRQRNADGSFRKFPHEDESSQLDLELLFTVCDVIDRFPVDGAMRKLVLKSVVTLLMKPVTESVRRHDLQCYFVLLHLPMFTEVGTYVVFSFLIKQVTALHAQFTHQLVGFFNRAGAHSIKTVVRMLRRFIDKRFFPPSPSALPPSHETQWWIPTAAKVMALLYAANNRLNEPPHVDHKTFYCRSMDCLELLDDFRSWSTGTPKRSFTFCQTPFLITTFAKRKLLTDASHAEMIDTAKRHLQEKVRKRQQPTAAEMFVDVRVERANLVQDSMREIVAHQSHLKKKLRVSFLGEEGVDLGGITKEWFMLLVRKVFSTNYGMFVKKPNRTVWFNGANRKSDDEYFLVGAVMGLAIYNSIILDIRLPAVTFKKLLSPPLAPPRGAPVKPGYNNFSLNDLASLDAEMGKSMKQLLEYDGNVEQDFGLDFTIMLKEFDRNKTFTLKRNGAKIKVTNENRREYVARYLTFVLNHYIEKQFEEFYRGFHSVCDSAVLQLLRPEELEAIICGEPYLDVKTLRKSVKYEGSLTAKDDLPRWLWEVVEEMKLKQQKKLLQFVTGCDRIPIGGHKDLEIKIRQVDAPTESLPVAHTCFNQLDLPPYRSKGQLQEKLTFAIENTEGFNLV